MATKKLTAEDIRLMSFNEIGAALNSGIVTDETAAEVLVARAKRKAEKKGTEVRTLVAA